MTIGKPDYVILAEGVALVLASSRFVHAFLTFLPPRRVYVAHDQHTPRSEEYISSRYLVVRLADGQDPEGREQKHRDVLLIHPDIRPSDTMANDKITVCKSPFSPFHIHHLCSMLIPVDRSRLLSHSVGVIHLTLTRMTDRGSTLYRRLQQLGVKKVYGVPGDFNLAFLGPSSSLTSPQEPREIDLRSREQISSRTLKASIGSGTVTSSTPLTPPMATLESLKVRSYLSRKSFRAD